MNNSRDVGPQSSSPRHKNKLTSVEGIYPFHNHIYATVKAADAHEAAR